MFCFVWCLVCDYCGARYWLCGYCCVLMLIAVLDWLVVWFVMVVVCLTLVFDVGVDFMV